MSERRFNRADALFLALIVAVGAWQFVCVDRSADFGSDDVFYADAAESMIRTGVYGIQGRAEGNQPPGLPALLVLVSVIFGGGHLAFLRAMVACGTAGLVAAYLLLRREAPRAVAGLACLVLLSSPRWFQLESTLVFPAFPFVLVTFLALLTLRRAETSPSPGVWIVLSSALTAASILTASAGIALLGAMAVRVVTVFLRDRSQGRAVLARFAPALVVGVAVQYAWMHHAGAPVEWPEVPGYPASYLAQLRVKNGNWPELGFATAGDLAIRVLTNIFERARIFAALLIGIWIRGLRVSAVILAPLALVLVGWIRSIRNRGGELHDWFFAGHEFIYLMWPWKTEIRFYAAVAPLAILYLWRGLTAVWDLAHERPALVARIWIPCATLGSILSVASGVRGERGHAWHGGVSLALWVLSGLAALWLGWADRRSADLAPAQSGWRRFLRAGPLPLVLPAAAVILGSVFLVHLAGDVQIARENLRGPEAPLPDVEAALWVREHTRPDAVVMARQIPIAYHVSHRKVVWFPPLSDAAVLMRGIRRLGVTHIIVADRNGDDYYWPNDHDCFAGLIVAYPGTFRLVFGDERVSIYEVASTQSARAALHQ